MLSKLTLAGASEDNKYAIAKFGSVDFCVVYKHFAAPLTDGAAILGCASTLTLFLLPSITR